MTSAEPRAPSMRRGNYLTIAGLTALIALAGFWPSYFGQILPGTLAQPPYIHLHAVVFSGWLALVITQAWFAASGRLALHKRIGPLIFLYGVLLVLVGWITAALAFRENVQAGNLTAASVGLFVPFTDLLFFLPVLFAAWAYRQKPEIHKRLIIVATCILLIPAAHRFVGAYIGRPPPLAPVLMVWLSPIVLGLAYDLMLRRVVHPVYLMGIAIVLAMKFRPPLHKTEAWQGFVAWFASVLT